ncbi:MAG: type III pantothenate kinase [Deltaproteobacteria bacterium]|nr:type III pantothenate kinase [Deltaproteobacteria bacterium]
MLFVIDSGNTSLKGAFIRNGKVDKVITQQEFTEDTINSIISLNCRICVSSVSEKSEDFVTELEKRGTDVKRLSHNMNFGIDLCVKNPSSVGIDRLCNASFGQFLTNGPCIVVDIGTAVTIDVVDKTESGYCFSGGIIAPGPVLFSKSLSDHTKALPLIDYPKEAPLIGKITSECIESSMTHGMVSMIEGLCRRICKNCNISYPVILTGGFASSLEKLFLVDVNYIENFNFLAISHVCYLNT